MTSIAYNNNNSNKRAKIKHNDTHTENDNDDDDQQRQRHQNQEQFDFISPASVDIFATFLIERDMHKYLDITMGDIQRIKKHVQIYYNTNRTSTRKRGRNMSMNPPTKQTDTQLTTTTTTCTPCLLWNSKEARVRIAKRRVECRRFVFEFCIGDLARGDRVYQSCTNEWGKICLQPQHLYYINTLHKQQQQPPLHVQQTLPNSDSICVLPTEESVSPQPTSVQALENIPIVTIPNYTECETPPRSPITLHTSTEEMFNNSSNSDLDERLFGTDDEMDNISVTGTPQQPYYYHYNYHVDCGTDDEEYDCNDLQMSLKSFPLSPITTAPSSIWDEIIT